MFAASLLCCVGSIAVWSLVAARLDSWRVSPALTLAVLGVVVGLLVRPQIAEVLNYHVTEQIVELVLATLLFSDAIAVKGKMLGDSPSVSARLLFIALPLSLLLAAAVAWAILPPDSLALALLVACVVMPSDISPAPNILADHRIPARVRSALNVESGYNDGIVAPVFAVALAAVIAASGKSGSSIVSEAFEAAAIAVAVGVAAGAGYGLAARWSRARAFSDDTAIRIGMLAVPLATYSLAVLFKGNGFVAAFVAGVVVHLCLRSDAERYTSLTKDVVESTSLALWFVFGVVAAYVVYVGVEWQAVVIAVAALTAIRAIPVALALVGSHADRAERLALSSLGPRGITTLVFGLLAFNAIDDDTAIFVLQIMIVTVALSLVMHGFGASSIAGRIFARRTATSGHQS